MIRFDDLTVFMLAMDNGDLSAVTHVLNTASAIANAAVKRLGAELGVRLLARSMRGLALTQEGEHYSQHTRHALADLQVGQGTLALGRQAIGGDVSLSIPSGLGRNVPTGWLDDFPTEHPAVALQVRTGDRLVDMSRQRVDAVVRYGGPEDSSPMALPLAPDSRRVLCAAPAYFARHGVPKTPNDLCRHDCLLLALSDTAHDQWTFHGASDDGQAHIMRVTDNRIVDDGRLTCRQAVTGHGIAYKSRLDVLTDLRAGRLQAVLTDWRGEAAPLHLICTYRLALSSMLMRLRDFLQERIAGYLADARIKTLPARPCHAPDCFQ